MSSSIFLLNASVRHAVFVQRFAGGRSREVLQSIDRVRKDAISKLQGKELTTYNRKRLKALIKDLTQTSKAVYSTLSDELKVQMKEFADYEAGFSKKMFDSATAVDFSLPSHSQLASGVFSTKMNAGVGKEKLTIEQALRAYGKVKTKRLIQTVKDGAVSGKTNQEIIKDINHTTRRIERNHASALVATITNHVSNSARASVYEANDDIIDGVKWVSTLDGSTTATCRSLDGQVFPVDSGPRPPAHWGCRSTTKPIVKKEFSVLKDVKTERPGVADGKVQDVKGTATYNSWLKKQSPEFQDEVLGETKGKLFRSGKYNMNSFVDKNYQELTLDELRRKDKLVFDSVIPQPASK